MKRQSTRTAWHLGAIGLVATMLMQTGAAQRSMTVSLGDALTYYELGEHDAVERALKAAGGGDPFAIVAMLKTDGPTWIDADGPERATRRRLVTATFALEAGYAGLDTQWEITTQLVEWACETLRRAGPPSEPERQWHLAALALLEGSFDPQGGNLLKHVAHVRSRFPSEPRLQLVQAQLKEWDFWATRLRTAGSSGGTDFSNDSSATIAIPTFQKALIIPDIRLEALLRLGYLEYVKGDLDVALTHLADASKGEDDPTRVYLAHLFSGWVHERAKRMPEATASFRRALEAVNALSAAVALGVRLYALDQRDEADAIVQTALTAAIVDPYKMYGYGDLRRWPAIIAGLRRSFSTR
jgi:hypothetical protein